MSDWMLLGSASDGDSALSWIVTIAVIVGGIVAYVQYRKYQARRITERETIIRDRLISEGTPPRMVVGAMFVTTKDALPCVLAVTDAQLFRFGMNDGNDRTFISSI